VTQIIFLYKKIVIIDEFMFEKFLEVKTLHQYSVIKYFVKECMFKSSSFLKKHIENF